MPTSTPASEIAVLYRTNGQSRPVEEALRERNIPYEVVGGSEFFDRREVKDVIAYFKVIANPLDEVSLLRIVRAIALVVISLVVAIVVPVPISMVSSSLTRLRERVRHRRYWCSSRRGDLRGSSGRDVPGRFASAYLDKVVLAGSGCRVRMTEDA